MRREMGIRGRAIWMRREKYWPLFDRLNGWNEVDIYEGGSW